MPFERQYDVTDAQAELYEYIIDYVCQNGFQPSIREMGERFGITGKAIVDRLHHLANKGMITLPPRGQGRCLTLNHVKFEVVIK